jgi:hypothetical protein
LHAEVKRGNEVEQHKQTMKGEVIMFGFTIPWDDVADTVTNLSFLNGEDPAGEHGFVGISQDGHFSYNGQRIRFFGGNLGMGANFPTHDESDIAAGRLAKLGCNLVRLHHMDMQYAPDGIWMDIGDGSKRTLHPDQMKKLDYLIYQLKQRGIFVNLNLHVTRTLTAADGIVHDEHMPDFNKGVDIFDSIMRNLHKEYATQLLTHVNQFTGHAYYNDRVIAMVEVTNEDSLLVVWQKGEIDELGDFYQDELDALWRIWWAEHIGGNPEPRPSRNDVRDGICSEDLAENYIDFLLSLEEDYHQDMVNHLQNIAGPEVGVQVPISGTQPGALDATINSSTFHDQHACYCCWSDSFFLDSITRYPFFKTVWLNHQPIPHISGGKVTGKPYVATELSSPHPNPHQAESILLAAVYGAFQDWDGLVIFAYRGDTVWNRDYVALKYDFDRHMTKLVAVTVAALLFRRNDIRTSDLPSLQVITTRKDVLKDPYNVEHIRLSEPTHALGHSVDAYTADEGYLPAYAALLRRIEIGKGDEHFASETPELPEDYIFRTDTGELEWYNDPSSHETRALSFFKVDTENVHVLAGAIDTEHMEIHHFNHGVLADGSIEVDPPSADSAMIAVILRDISPEGIKTYLITATGKIENTGQRLQNAPRPQNLPDWAPLVWKSVRIWAAEPFEVRVEGIGAYITLHVHHNRVRFFSLNPDGSENTELDVDNLGGDYCGIRLSEDNQTLWYKVEITR